MNLFARPWLLLLAPLAAVAMLYAERIVRSTGGTSSWLRRALRAMIIVVLVAAASGMRLSAGRVRPPVILAVDVSASTGDVNATEEAVRELLRGLPAGTPRAAVAFASQSRVALRFDQKLESLSLGEISSTVSRDNSDLAGGLRMALGMIPPRVAGAVVLLSDGRSTTGSPASSSVACRARDVRLYAVPRPSTDFADSRIEHFLVPARLESGRPLPVSVSMATSRRVDVQLVVRRLPGGNEVGSTRISLRPGAIERAFYTDKPTGRGVLRYEAVLTPLDGAPDAFPQNNVADAGCLIVDTPRVLIISEGQSSAADVLAQLDHKFTIDLATPGGIPGSADALVGYAAVIIEDVKRDAVSATAEKALVEYVRSGGGLLLVGGPHAYGAGTWRDSDPLAEIIPVSMSPGPRDRALVILLVDASGSMAMEGSQGRTKIEDARDAIAAILPELGPEDEVALIAFRDSASVILEATPVAGLTVIVGELDELTADGKTSLAVPLQAALDMLAASDAQRTVVVMLSDGEPTVDVPVAQLRALAAQCAARGAPVHVLGTNPQPAHRALLQEIATAGGGSAVFESNYARVSDALRQAVAQATGRYVAAGPVAVRMGDGAAQVIGTLDALPALGALNRTSMRGAALAAIVSRGEDPVLAVMEVGPGRTAAFTSSFSGAWGGALGGWPKRGALLMETLRWLAVPPGNDAVHIRTMRDGRSLFVEVDVDPGSDLDERNLLAITVEAWRLGGSGRLPTGDSVSRSLQAEQIGLGRYRAELPAGLQTNARSILARVFVTSGPGERKELARAPLQLMSSRELMQTGVDRNALTALVQPTGGRVLNGPSDLAQALGDREVRAARDISPELAALALVLMLAELLARFLIARGTRGARP